MRICKDLIKLSFLHYWADVCKITLTKAISIKLQWKCFYLNVNNLKWNLLFHWLKSDLKLVKWKYKSECNTSEISIEMVIYLKKLAVNFKERACIIIYYLYRIVNQHFLLLVCCSFIFCFEDNCLKCLRKLYKMWENQEHVYTYVHSYIHIYNVQDI